MCFGVIEEFVSLEASDAGDDFCPVLRDVVNLDDALDGAVLAEGAGVEDLYFQFHGVIQFGAFGSLVAQLYQNRLAAAALDLRVALDFQRCYHEDVLLDHLLLFAHFNYYHNNPRPPPPPGATTQPHA